MRSFIALFFFVSTISCASDNAARSLLIGGGFKVCSSYSTKYCTEAKSFQGGAFVGNRYKITSESITLLEDDRFEIFKSQSRKQDLIELLKKYLLRNKSETLARREFLRKLDGLSLSSTAKSGRDVLEVLSPFEENFFMQTMQLPVITSNGTPQTEYVLLEQSDADSVAIVSRFIEMVKEVSNKERPLILFSTASANDVFDAVSFYYQLFNSKDVDVAWLPIEASMNQVVEDERLSCNDLERVRAQQFGIFSRERVYAKLAKYQMNFCQNPKMLSQLLELADGLFFNGGDQSLTLASLSTIKDGKKRFGPNYEIINKRFKEGRLVLAGTSAGTAVQSGGLVQGKKIPMVTNGESEYGFVNGSVATNFSPSPQCEFEKSCDKNTTLKSLTRFDAGGFELMPLGIFDTHFSERDRLFRLIRLLEDSGITLGIGIDENTALEMNSLGGEVVLRGHGEGATWIIQSKPDVSNKFDLHMIWKNEQAAINSKSINGKGKLIATQKVTNRIQKIVEKLATRDDKVSQILTSALDNSHAKTTKSINVAPRCVNFELDKSKNGTISIELSVQ